MVQAAAGTASTRIASASFLLMPKAVLDVRRGGELFNAYRRAGLHAAKRADPRSGALAFEDEIGLRLLAIHCAAK